MVTNPSASGFTYLSLLPSRKRTRGEIVVFVAVHLTTPFNGIPVPNVHDVILNQLHCRSPLLLVVPAGPTILTLLVVVFLFCFTALTHDDIMLAAVPRTNGSAPLATVARKCYRFALSMNLLGRFYEFDRNRISYGLIY